MYIRGHGLEHEYYYICMYVQLDPWEFCPDTRKIISTTSTKLKKILEHMHTETTTKAPIMMCCSDRIRSIRTCTHRNRQDPTSELGIVTYMYVSFPCAIYKRPDVPHSLVSRLLHRALGFAPSVANWWTAYITRQILRPEYHRKGNKTQRYMCRVIVDDSGTLSNLQLVSHSSKPHRRRL